MTIHVIIIIKCDSMSIKWHTLKNNLYGVDLSPAYFIINLGQIYYSTKRMMAQI